MDQCPICGKPFRLQCKCDISDRECANGHHWHTCPIHQKLVIGEFDHRNRRADGCSCSKNLAGLDPNQRAGVLVLIIGAALFLWLQFGSKK